MCDTGTIPVGPVRRQSVAVEPVAMRLAVTRPDGGGRRAASGDTAHAIRGAGLTSAVIINISAGGRRRCRLCCPTARPLRLPPSPLALPPSSVADRPSVPSGSSRALSNRVRPAVFTLPIAVCDFWFWARVPRALAALVSLSLSRPGR